MNKQSSNIVVMVRPHHFSSNPETIADNSFQSVGQGEDVAQRAYQEVTAVAEALRQHGITVHLYEDKGTATPDSVFPNNWFTTHNDGTLVLYPMYCSNRRLERRQDIIHDLTQRYGYLSVVDLSHYEQRDQFLEGTGSIVFDHHSRLAYAARSQRMNPSVLAPLCQRLGYRPVVFDALDSGGQPIYHTNVMMAVGSDFVMACPGLIRDQQQRQVFVDTVTESGKELVELSEAQIAQFAGNTLELAVDDKRLLAMSATAMNALTEQQQQQLEQWVSLLPLDVPTIELGGGSIRCMLAQVFSPND